MCNLLLMNNQGRLFKWRTFSVPSIGGASFFVISMSLHASGGNPLVDAGADAEEGYTSGA